jgi:copper chaperone CopZ
MKTILNVTGMSCAGCVKHVSEALKELPRVRQVEVMLREGRVEIEHDNALSSERMISAVREAGYDASQR